MSEMIKYWVTRIYALNPKTGEMTHYVGPIVPGETEAQAKKYLQENGLGYCRIAGRHIKTLTFGDGEKGNLFYSPYRDN